MDIRSRAQALLQKVQRAKTELRSWQASIPSDADLSPEHRNGYVVHAESTKNAVAARISVLDQVDEALQSKAEDPAVTPAAPDCSLLSATLPVASLQHSIAEHNQEVDEHSSVVEGRYEIVLDHIVGSRADLFRQHEANATATQDQAKRAAEGAELA